MSFAASKYDPGPKYDPSDDLEEARTLGATARQAGVPITWPVNVCGPGFTVPIKPSVYTAWRDGWLGIDKQRRRA